MNSSLTVSGGAMPGQSVLTTFSGTANEVVNLVTAWSADTNLYMDILAPDGSELTGWGNKGSPVDIRNLVLPSTGTYTVVIYTNNNISIPSVTLTLSQNVTEGTIAMNSSLTVSGGAMPGQSVLTTFSGTANEVVNLLTAWSVDTNLYMDILAPDGSELTGWGNKGSSVNISSPALPSTGTYTVVVYTNNNINVPSLTFTLSD
jgi:fluoride ion exporter CrcB/FEX